MTRCIAIFLWMSATVLYAQVPEWKVQYDSAQRYWGGQWQKSIPFLVKAEKAALYDLGIYDENYLVILNDLGLAYAKTGDYANAERMLTKAVSIRTESGAEADEDLQRTTLNLAAIHAEQQHWKEAETRYLKVLDHPEYDAAVLDAALKGIVAVYESSGRPDQAIALLDDTRFSSRVTSPEWQIIRARLAREGGRYSESMRVLAALQPSASSASGDQYLEWLQESALNHLETGNFGTAEKQLLEGIRLLKSDHTAGNKTTDAASTQEIKSRDAQLTSLLNNLATVYEKLRLREKALLYYQEALPLCQKVYGVKSINTLTLQSNIAGIYLSNGQVPQAIAQYQEVEQHLGAIAGEQNVAYLTVINNLATAYRANKENDKARQMLARALSIIDKYKLGDTDLAATVLNNQAVLLTAGGQFNEAASCYERALGIRKKIYGESSVRLSEIAGNLAVVYWELGKTTQALPLFSQSSEMAIRQIKYIFPNLSEGEQVQFYRKLKEDFERFNAIAFRASSENPALLRQVFNNQLMLKSLRFFTQRHRSDIAAQMKDTVLVRQFGELRAKREQLGYLYQQTLAEISHTPVTITQLEREIDALEKTISLRTSESVSTRMSDQSLTWSDIQKNMTADAALVEVVRYRKYDLRKLVTDGGTRAMFGFTDSVYYAALVTTSETKGNPRLALMKDGRNMETRYLSYYRNALQYVVDDELSYNVYWKKIGVAIGNRKHVYFSADGVYHQVNLNTLREGANAFIADRHDIHYLLSPAQYSDLEARTLQGKRATLFGDPEFGAISGTAKKNRSVGRYLPLPGTRAEVQDVDGLLRKKGWTSQVHMKDRATEANVKAVRGVDILHIASHGFFSIEKINPGKEFNRELTFNSGLLLSGANKSLQEETTEFHDDGILTAYEVANLDLNGTSLVVLSACETGLGNIEIGEGVYGLQRSFLQAGAQNVLISLWKVDDDITRKLMTSFYTYLLNTPDIHAALSNAQRDLRKQYPNPSAWGGFILVGK